jgi:mRNA-degrading endonuclease RelE of RelBE toxin-antitoxin system
MARKQGFSLIFDEKIHEHLDAIDDKYHSLIEATIHEQLEFEPETETKNRKPLKKPTALGATWELRFGPGNRFRVLYATDHEKRAAEVLAIGVKDRNRLMIGGEEVKL